MEKGIKIFAENTGDTNMQAMQITEKTKIGNAKSANDGPVGRVSKVINFDSIREGPDPVVDLQAFFLRKLTGNIGTSASPTREKRESVRESALYTWGRGDTRHNSIT
ncbi:hypothetical protein LOAG_01684 [Loa loa]|uniref:Uncharacterized protein n=1 Tax=Loa loa TaxID=7209 RepID=A0A1S0UAF1_LOALO|nr:hypothetical protein LOAG_01684 [Loa loa]EFO26798.1 hypothetical protein LOAG_01684 [Loa loa]